MSGTKFILPLSSIVPIVTVDLQNVSILQKCYQIFPLKSNVIL